MLGEVVFHVESRVGIVGVNDCAVDCHVCGVLGSRAREIRMNRSY